MSSTSFSFLPEVISYNGDWDVFVELAYARFRQDFIESRPNFKGRPVHVNRSKSDGDLKENGFWHLITRDDKKAGSRLPDLRRAERISWVRPIIENYLSEGINYWETIEGSGFVRHYFYAEPVSYVVILEEKPSNYFLVTGFCVDSDWKRKDLEKKRERSRA